MRAYLLVVGLLGMLAGCSADWDPASRERVRSGDAPDAAIAGQPGPVLPGRASAEIADLPDRGDLVAYDRSRPPIKRGAYTWHPVQLSEAHALRAAVGGELVLTGPNGRPIRLRLDRHIEHPDGNWTWIGREPGSAPGTEAIITFGAKAVFGSIPYGDQEPLRLVMSAGRAWLVETDRTVIAQGNNPGTRPREPDFLPAPRRNGRSMQAAGASVPGNVAAESVATVAAATTVDVVLGYTGSFAARLGGQSQAVTRLTYLVDVTNQAYANSQVSAQLRLVRTQQVTYPDTTSNRQALYDLSGVQCTEKTDGSLTCTEVGVPAALQPLHAARDQYGGDLVSLVRNFNNPENDGCGIAWLNGAGLTAITKQDEASGLSVISDSSGNLYPDNGFICRDETLAHELGHNMGSAHERDTAEGDDNVLQQNEYGAFPYSFGHKTTSTSGNFYTIMAYGDEGQARYRLFSNPGITVCGGWPCGVVDQADNARSLRQTVPIVATFRDAPAPPAAARVLLRELDANGNGTSDLLLRSHTAARFVTWYMSGTTRTAYSATALGNAYTLAGTGDFNGDRRTDLVWTSPARDIVVSISTGTGYASYLTSYTYGAGTQVLGAADVNGNGKADILLRNAAAGRLYVWFMDGTTRTAYNAHVVAPTLAFVGNGDLNKDGRQDLVWTDPHRNVVIGLSAGVTFGTSQTGLAYNSDYDLVGVTDVNGNGTADLILRSAPLGKVVTWFMDGTARVAYSSKSVSALYRLVGKGDFNGDRRGDLAWTNGTGGVMFSLSTGVSFADSLLAYTYPADYALMDVQ